MACTDLYTWVEDQTFVWIDDASFSWDACSSDSNLNQIWRDELYVFVAHSVGLDIIEITNGIKVAYVFYSGGFTSVWASDDYVYLGTDGAGIKYIDKADILIDRANPINLNSVTQDYNYFYMPSTDTIKYLHGHRDNLAVVTSSGIDILNNHGATKLKSTFQEPNVTKCFVTPDGKLYYIIQNTVSGNGVYRKDSILCDWVSADTDYISGASFLPSDIDVNDIFVTTNTSVSGTDNTLFTATSSGVLVLDEESDEYVSYYSILAGTSRNIAGIWADDEGMFQAVSTGEGAALSVVDTNTNKLYDRYTLSIKGRANQVLIQEDTVDVIG